MELHRLADDHPSCLSSAFSGSITYPNGLQSTFTYDQQNRLTELSTPPVADYKYTLGPTGNRTGATEQSGRTLAWNFDGIYRLTNETVTSDPTKENGSVAYGLDPVGNRQSVNSSLNGGQHRRPVLLQCRRPASNRRRGRHTTPTATRSAPAAGPSPTIPRTAYGR
jgi:hypothetical protein